jgi:hypothetical protein
MKSLKIIILFVIGGLFASCTDNVKVSKDEYAVENYIKKEELNKNLEPIFPYLAKLENGVNYNNRFDDSSKGYFIERQKFHKFSFERYFINKDSVHYFLIWKVAPSLYEKKIAIGGRYKKDAQGKIYAFEEIFNTPKMKLDELKEKSFMLFDYMVQNGNVEKFYGHYDLVEFPDGKCMYDKENSKWILTDNPRWAPVATVK